MKAHTALALEIGAYATRLKRGEGLTTTARGDLVELLLRVAMALLGRDPPARLDADPAALVSLSVQVAREAGMDPLALHAVFNDAAERSIRRQLKPPFGEISMRPRNGGAAGPQA